jgi:multicomponent Na+:H+ antiporter subunit D
MIVRGVGVATATLGVGFAMFEKDAKRMLAFHTVSQVGFILAAPLAGGIYALSHGLVKSCLFLSAGQLHSRKFVDLKSKPISFGLWFALSLAGLSISGLPFFYGYGAKALTMAELLSWQSLAMNIISIGTAISFSKFIFLPHTKLTFESMDGGKRIETKTFYPYLAIAMLLLCLVAGSLTHLDVYVTSLMLKAVVIILIGWSCYHLIIKKLTVKLPREFEKVDHLIGLMTLMIVTLFWKILI